MAKCELKKKVLIEGVTLEVTEDEFKALLLGIGRMSDHDVEQEWRFRGYSGNPPLGLLKGLWNALSQTEKELLDNKEEVG